MTNIKQESLLYFKKTFELTFICDNGKVFDMLIREND